MIVITTPAGQIGLQVLGNLLATGSLAMDHVIAANGQACRALTNPYFMEDAVRQAESIKDQGVFFWLIAGDRKLSAFSFARACPMRWLRGIPTWPGRRTRAWTTASCALPENSTPTSIRKWCEEVLKPAVAL